MRKSRVIIDSTSAGVSMDSRGKEGGTAELNLVEYETMKLRINQLEFGTIMMHEGNRWFVQQERNDDQEILTRFSLLERVSKAKCVGKRAFVHDGKYYLVLTSISHALNRDRNGRYWWNVIGNPTSAITGSNVRPVELRKGNKVDSLRYMMSFCFRMLIDILHLQDTSISERVRLGFFTMHNVQFAVYLPVEHKRRVLNLLSTVYGLGITKEEDLKTLSFAKLLGFDFKTYERIVPSMEQQDVDSDAALRIPDGDEESAHTGFMLSKRAADRSYEYNINMYDKEAHGEYTGLQHLNSDKNKKLVSDTIRVDITLHKRFYSVLFNAASKASNGEVDYYTVIKKKGKKEEIVIEDIAVNICKAIAALEANCPGGFTGWLVREILVDRMCLFSVWSILSPDFDLVEEVKKFFDERNSTFKGNADLSEVFNEWERSEKLTLMQVMESIGISSRTRYALADELELKTGLSKNVPFLVVAGMQAEIMTFGFKGKQYRQYYKSIKDDKFEGFGKLMKSGKGVLNKIVSAQHKKAMRILNDETRTGTISMVTAKAR